MAEADLKGPVIHTLETGVVSKVCAARMVCATHNGFQLDASFDSGADHSVEPPQTLKHMEAARQPVKVKLLPKSITVKGYVGPARSITHEVTINLRFDTESGPLKYAMYVVGYQVVIYLRVWVTYCLVGQ